MGGGGSVCRLGSGWVGEDRVQQRSRTNSSLSECLSVDCRCPGLRPAGECRGWKISCSILANRIPHSQHLSAAPVYLTYALPPPPSPRLSVCCVVQGLRRVSVCASTSVLARTLSCAPRKPTPKTRKIPRTFPPPKLYSFPSTTTHHHPLLLLQPPPLNCE